MTATPRRKRGRPAADDQTRARKREDILATAAVVFAARGYPGTDVQAVADAAGVAKGTLYLYFVSKEELFLAAVDQGIRELQQFIDTTIADIADPLERIVQAFPAVRRGRLAPGDESVRANQRCALGPHTICGREPIRDVFEIAGRLNAVPHDAKRTSRGTAPHTVGPAAPIAS